MTNWQQFLEASGAQWRDDVVTSFGEMPGDYGNLTNTVSDLGNVAILSAQGSDSAKFLQGQSTCDLLGLEPGRSTPGAICNPKGRMITTFLAYKVSDKQILLSMDKPLVETSLATLDKYAAFFKTTLSDCSDTHRQFGIAGPSVKQELLKFFPAVRAPNHFVTDDVGNILNCLNDSLFTIVTKTNQAESLWRDLTTTLTTAGLPWWQLQLIRAGLASVSAELSEQFVPQMLNLQATGAISFSKGCYTGQEVVARMQYLGKLKRRTYIVEAASPTPPPAGTEIATIHGKLVGTVINAAASDASNFSMLAVLRETALAQDELVIAEQTIPVKISALPYELAEQ